MALSAKADYGGQGPQEFATEDSFAILSEKPFYAQAQQEHLAQIDKVVQNNFHPYWNYCNQRFTSRQLVTGLFFSS